MKKTNKNKTSKKDDMLPEYSFKEGVRGKHYIKYRKGHSVKILKKDGSTIIQNFTLNENSVILEPEVKKYFPDSKSVNGALRTIINLFPNKI
jgi:hypothetical protein